MRVGYTLPVFAVAAAKAALLILLDRSRSPDSVEIDLLEGAGSHLISIEQVARLDAITALGITRSDPGSNLDLTRHTPIWAWVQLSRQGARDPRLRVEAGQGVGKTQTGEGAIYAYAQRLFTANLLPLLDDQGVDPTQTDPEAIDSKLAAQVRIILPEGEGLAQRTSNAAFGIVQGLALLGTHGIAEPASAVASLHRAQEDLREKVVHNPDLVFCIGSHAQAVAEGLGIPAHRRIQTSNWLGALLVEAGLRQAKSVLLVGYQGKLLKLAGGIFNTSSHLADARLEILSGAMLRVGCSAAQALAVLELATTDAAQPLLEMWGCLPPVYAWLAQAISQRSQAYVAKYADVELPIGSVLFDRQGRILHHRDP